MASKKAGGSAKNLRDSQPKYLGTKLYAGEVAKVGSIIVRQRGSVILPGKGVRMGKDHTLFATTTGKVSFSSVRRLKFNNTTSTKKIVNVL